MYYLIWSTLNRQNSLEKVIVIMILLGAVDNDNKDTKNNSNMTIKEKKKIIKLPEESGADCFQLPTEHPPTHK